VNTPSQLSIIPRLATPHKHTCYFCGHTGDEVHLEDALNWRGRDVMRYGCDDVKACLERIEIRRENEELDKTTQENGCVC